MDFMNGWPTSLWHFRQEFHPFSISSIDGDDAFRITIKALGDCTRHIQSIESGALARVQVDSELSSESLPRLGNFGSPAGWV